jgi:hypothetical protein
MGKFEGESVDAVPLGIKGEFEERIWECENRGMDEEILFPADAPSPGKIRHKNDPIRHW